MRTSLLFTIVFLIHAIAIGGFVSMQGCATRGTTVAQAPKPPVPPMPPAPPSEVAYQPAPLRTVKPVPVAPAPTTPPVYKKDPALTYNKKPDPAKRGGKEYVIKKGDMISKIAYAHGLSSRELMDFNNMKNGDMIFPGDKIYLPPHAKKGPAVARTTGGSSSGSKPAPAVSGDHYVVKSGDVLSRIAVNTGTSVRALKQANKLQGDTIYVGQKLVLPKGSSVPVSEPSSTDALLKAVDALGDEPAATEKPEAGSEKSGTSDTLTFSPDLPKPAAPASPPASEPSEPVDGSFVYTVQSGETLQEIARAFIVDVDEIRTLNSIAEGGDVKVGDQIKIPPSEF